MFVPPLAVAAIAVHLTDDLRVVEMVVFRAVLLFVVAPLVILTWLKYSGRITSFDIPDRRNRAVPLVSGFLLAVVAIPLVSMSSGSAAGIMGVFLAGLAVTVAIAAVITTRFKLSLHVAAFAALSITLFWLAIRIPPFPDAVFVVTPNCALYAVLVTIGLGAARVQIRAHSLREVMIGAAFGLIAGGVVMALAETALSRTGFSSIYLQ